MKTSLLRLAIGIPLGILALLFVFWVTLPWPGRLRERNPEQTSLMRYRVAQAAAADEPYRIRQSWMSLEDISDAVIRAVVTAEDGRFREHGGVDWEALADEVGYEGNRPFRWTAPADWAALAGALTEAWSRRDELRGRSTITQQLAKNLYWTPERSLRRKVGELVVARRLERALGKDRILELYLNTVELGPGIFGVDAAARAYFGVGAGELGRWQAATLAATLPHPLTSNPDHRPSRMAWRRDLILQRMGSGRATAGGIPTAPEIVQPGAPVLAPADTALGDAVPPAEPADTGAAPPDTSAAPAGRDTVRVPPDTGRDGSSRPRP